MTAIATPLVRPSIAADPVTPEELLRMEDAGLYELVDGKVIEKQMSYAANKVAGTIARLLDNHCESDGVGDVLPEQSFQCFPHTPSRVRRLDIALIVAARVPATLPQGHVTIVPDLAVEVVSPNDLVYELEEKLADYRSAGIPLVWVVHPEARVIRVHRPGKPIDELFDGDVLTADPILPGFSVSVIQLLPASSAVATGQTDINPA